MQGNRVPLQRLFVGVPLPEGLLWFVQSAQAALEPAPLLGAAVEVGELAPGEHQRPEGERVAAHDPLQLGDAQVERALDRRERHVHDRVVEHDDEQPERDGGERPPLPVLPGDDRRPRLPRLQAHGKDVSAC